MTKIYAGDLTPTEAWTLLKDSENAVLIDVRTSAEWAWVGQVDLSSIGKKHAAVEWVQFPGGVPNGNFVEQVMSLVSDKSHEILFLCRSGVRSQNAAIALTQVGYEKCYNILGGFEGDPDANKHRGTTNGWKVANLPWIQS